MSLDRLRQKERLPEEHINTVFYKLTELLNGATELDEKLREQIRTIWRELVRKVNPTGKSQDAQDMAWQLFEAILEGDMDMHRINSVGSTSYDCFCAPPQVISERTDNEMRNQIRAWLKEENFGNATRRRPRIGNLIANNSHLQKDARLQQIFLVIVRDHKKHRRADTTGRLSSDTEMLALAKEDNIDVYFATVAEFFTYLSDEVFKNSSHPHAKEIAAFFRFVAKIYLPVAQQYCRQMRSMKGAQPHIEKLLLDAHLGRNGQRIKEPVPTELFKKWEEVKLFLTQFAGYKGSKHFSFSDTLNKNTATTATKEVTVEKKQAVVSASVGRVTGRPAAVAETVLDVSATAPLREQPASPSVPPIQKGGTTLGLAAQDVQPKPTMTPTPIPTPKPAATPIPTPLSAPDDILSAPTGRTSCRLPAFETPEEIERKYYESLRITCAKLLELVVNGEEEEFKQRFAKLSDIQKNAVQSVVNWYRHFNSK